MTSLGELLDWADGQVNQHKLNHVRRLFRSSLGEELYSTELDDPIVLRRHLVEEMRRETASAGTVQAISQFFMGIVRRAAIEHLVPPPPEGPWTKSWQSVLDLAEESQGTKAKIRSLAGWGTERHVEPSDVEAQHFLEWVSDLKLDKSAIPAVEKVLNRWQSQLQPPAVLSDSIRAERLKRKALHGTVYVERGRPE